MVEIALDKLHDLSIREVQKDLSILESAAEEHRYGLGCIKQQRTVATQRLNKLIDELYDKNKIIEKWFTRPYRNENIERVYNKTEYYQYENTRHFRYDFDRNTDEASIILQRIAVSLGYDMERTHTRIFLNDQPPGSFFPKHLDFLDTWSSLNEQYLDKITYMDINRHVLFLSDQDVGHFYMVNGDHLTWRPGDIYDQEPYAYHATGNGSTDTFKRTIVFEGVSSGLSLED